MSEIIEPKVLKGFRDYLPRDETARRALMETLEKVFRSFGFVPIDTPALEYAEVLLGKGGGETDKQVYRFQDKGGRDVALRFDLTVPFARFMAEHVDELYLPFRRYHMAKVWRGENTQRGRYREFMQCDFDIVGAGFRLGRHRHTPPHRRRDVRPRGRGLHDPGEPSRRIQSLPRSRGHR